MRRVAAFAAVALAVACRSNGSALNADQRIDDAERGVRYTCPAGWSPYDGEIRSSAGSLLTLRVFDLVDADHKFVAGLPETILPQLAGWARHYYIVEGDPTRAETQVAGNPATEWTYPVRVRQKDPPTKVTYWVVHRGTRLFVIRAAYPPAGLAVDEPKVREVLSGWEFVAKAS